MATINRQQLILELNVNDPILVREATRVFKENYFDPAVEKLNNDFENHIITKELDAAAQDVSIEGESGMVSGGDSTEGKNLYAFIGFEQGENPTDEIRQYLDPTNKNGPNFRYIRGSQNKNIEFQFEVKGPNLDAIYESTPMPWAPGLSWVNRIEVGIPGLGKFLNKLGLKGSRSGGGIQVKNTLRKSNFKPKKYLSTIINNFIKQFI